MRRLPPKLTAFSLVFPFALLAGCSSEPSSPEATKGDATSKGSSSTTNVSSPSDDIPRKHLSGGKKGTVVWEKMSPSTSPAASINVSMAFDDTAAVSILFNGDDRAMWTWDGTDWTKLAWPDGQPNPGNRDSEIVIDRERGRVVLYGGFDLEVSSGCQRCNDTWEWFGGAWTKREDVGTAGGLRNGHRIVYDSDRKVTVLTGGFVPGNDPILDSSTWEYDGSSWGQTVAVGGGYLPERWLHAASYDPDRKKVVLFGGTDVTRATRYADTWEYDGTSWAKITPSGAAPTARHSHALVYDSIRKVTVLYGGEAISTPDIQWDWDGTSWTNMPVGPVNPDIRDQHAMAFDPVRRRVVLFGGIVGNDETWEMHVRGNSCVTADDCHTGFCVDGVCCETACDGTCEACNADLTGGEDGLCAPITAGTDPDDECAEGVGADAACAPGTCNGAGSCTVNQGVTCQAASCADPVTVQPAATCNAGGVCQPSNVLSCGVGETCLDGACVPDGEDLDGGASDAEPDADLDAGDEDAGDEDAGLDAGDEDAGDDAGSDAGDAGEDDAGVDAAPPIDGGDELVPTTTSLSTSTPAVQEGTSLEVEVKVTADEGTPSGTVTVRDAELTLGTVTLEDGEAWITVTLTGVGEHELVALYPGSDTHAPSTSSPLVVTVNGANAGEYGLVGGGCAQAPGASHGGYWAVVGAAVVMAFARRRRDTNTQDRG